MREGDEIGPVSGVADFQLMSDDIRQRSKFDKLGDRQFAHREDKSRAQYFKFPPQPVRARPDFTIVGNTVSALGVFARETTADRREIHPVANLVFGPTQRRFHPAEQGFSSCPGKRTAQERFLHAGGLSNKENFAAHRTADNHRFVHGRAPAAGF